MKHSLHQQQMLPLQCASKNDLSCEGNQYAGKPLTQFWPCGIRTCHKTASSDEYDRMFDRTRSDSLYNGQFLLCLVQHQALSKNHYGATLLCC